MGSVAVEDLWRVFRGGTTALRGLDLHVEPGEFFVVLGPSGCGKTTLLRLIAGLDHPTRGRILIDGRDVTEDNPKERNVAMVFQNYSLYPHMTVYDNIAFGLQSHKLPKDEIEVRVQRAAEVLGVDDMLKRKPRQLSGGQQQRVAMGRAIVREPEAFLMDEPLSNVDPRTRIQIRTEIARIQKELGITTIYVTHDQNEAMVLGDRIGVLREGVLQQIAEPRKLHRRPDNLFVAGFVGTPPMNLAEATVEETPEGLFVRFGGHRIRAGDGETLRAYAWKQVVVGVRPEDLARAPSSNGADLEVTVDHREVTGSEVYVLFKVDAPLLLAEDPRLSVEPQKGDPIPPERLNTWVARLDEDAPTENEAISLTVRPGALYLFDPRTGDAIPH
jgi:multiple sugar transport system ATP-binding protein